MKTTYTVLHEDGRKTRGGVDWPPCPGFDAIRRLVEPLIDGPLEHVLVLHEGTRTDMFVDELGHIRTVPKRLNDAATAIYRAFKVSRGAVADSLPTIVGTAVVFDRIVWR